MKTHSSTRRFVIPPEFSRPDYWVEVPNSLLLDKNLSSADQEVAILNCLLGEKAEKIKGEDWELMVPPGSQTPVPRNLLHDPFISHHARMLGMLLFYRAATGQLVPGGHAELATVLNCPTGKIKRWLRELQGAGWIGYLDLLFEEYNNEDS